MKAKIARAVAVALFITTLLLAGAAPYGQPGLSGDTITAVGN